MHPLALERYLARKDDPASPFIWGYAAKMLKYGGTWNNEGKYEYLKKETGSHRNPRQIEYYPGEYVTEPDPNESSWITTAKLIRYMLKAGFTATEARQALEDPSNVGGEFYRWEAYRRPEEGLEGWWNDLVNGRTLDKDAKRGIIPMSEPYSVPVKESSFTPCPKVQIQNIDTGQIIELGKLDHTTLTSKPLGCISKGSMNDGSDPVWINPAGTFKVEIRKKLAWSICQHIRYLSEPVPRSELVSALKVAKKVPQPGIIEAYLSWLEQENFLCWDTQKLMRPYGNSTRLKSCSVAVLTESASETFELFGLSYWASEPCQPVLDPVEAVPEGIEDEEPGEPLTAQQIEELLEQW